MDRLVPYHMCCAYVLTETARDLSFVHLKPAYKHLEVPHGFRFEIELIFTH